MDNQISVDDGNDESYDDDGDDGTMMNRMMDESVRRRDGKVNSASMNEMLMTIRIDGTDRSTSPFRFY